MDLQEPLGNLLESGDCSMFILEQLGPEEEQKAPYSVTLDKEYTVRDFIHEVLINHSKDWGLIGIFDGESVVGDMKCDYDRGYLQSDLPKEIMDEPIYSVSAYGGHYRMDYLLYLERDRE